MKLPLPKNSRLIIYPTESSYALGCRYDDHVAIQRIMHLKGRTDDRFTLVASSLQQVKRHFSFSKEQEKLAKQYWPGALSIVVSDKYAVRVPGNSLARDVAAKAGVPILATSLNVSGQAPLHSLQHLPEQFKDIPSINIGILPIHAPSTVVECVAGKVIIHRQGAVRLKGVQLV